MKQLENCMVVCKNPVMEGGGSNRINTVQSEYTAFENIEVDFSTCLTTDEVRDCLEKMNKLGMHIMGSRGYVYHSQKLADMIEFVDEGMIVGAGFRVFPRTFGLREKLKQVSPYELA